MFLISSLPLFSCPKETVEKCMNHTDTTGPLSFQWSEQSGEISLSHGMPQAGDLSAQRFNSPRDFYPHTAMSLRSR